MVKKQLMIEAAQDLRRLADKVESLAEAIVEEGTTDDKGSVQGEKQVAEDVISSVKDEPSEKNKNSREKQDAIKNKESGKKLITSDDITKLVVAKIKKNRNNQESIGKLVASYGVDHLSKIPEEKYESFIRDLSEI